jgi:serine/threonine protein kinase
MNSPEQPVCPKCGAPLASDAPGGLCPRCLIGLNLNTETAVTGEDDAVRRPPLTPEEIAPHFPQLEVLECLGRGGMGVVYKARQRSLGRLVALKLLAPEREKDHDFAARFAREAKALAQLSHPHIVTVHDFGQTNGFFYLLMEFVDGVNLRDLLRTRRLSPEEALAIVPPLCEALQFAHERGIVHRDIKPENLLLAKDGSVKIADFGIAKMMGPESDAQRESGTAGTPGYMAPEQENSPERVDSRADIYSLGVVFYEMLTGEKPARDLQPPSRKVQLDIRIDEIVLRALERTPELRFQTAAEFRTAVQTVASTSPVSARSAATARPPEDRPWMRVLGWVLLVPGILIAVFGLCMLWLLLREPNWHPKFIEAFVTIGSWIASVILLGGSALLLRYSRKDARISATPNPAELKPWQKSWLAEPVRRRRTVFWSLVALTLALFACFAWPQYSVTSRDGIQMSVLSFGYPEPWLKEIRTFGAAGMQNWLEHRVGILAFLAGVIGMFCWILAISIHDLELRVLAPSLRKSFGNIVISLLLCIGALAHMGLLACAIIPAQPLTTVAITVAFGTPVLLRAALTGRAATVPHASSSLPSSERVIYAIALAVLVIMAIFLVIAGSGGTLGRRAASPVPPVPVEAAPVHGVQDKSEATPDLRKLMVDHWYNFYLKPGNEPIARRKDGQWNATLHAAKLVRFIDGTKVEVTYPRRPDEHFGMLGARMHDMELPNARAFQKWEQSVTEWSTRTIDASEIDRITAVEERTAPATTGQKQPAPPDGAAFTSEQQVIVPADSRVSLELFRQKNDANRIPLGGKLVFKTAAGSGRGVVVRWYGYAPDHPSHANHWIVDLIDPQDGTTFHRREEVFDAAVKMAPIDGAAPGGAPSSSDLAKSELTSGSWAFIRLLRAEKITNPGEPVRDWWEVHAFVTLHSSAEAENPAEFQLPTVLK